MSIKTVLRNLHSDLIPDTMHLVVKPSLKKKLQKQILCLYFLCFLVDLPNSYVKAQGYVFSDYFTRLPIYDKAGKNGNVKCF